MGTCNSSQMIVRFSMVCAMFSTSIPILMAQSAGVNFNFSEFTRCNTSDILCVNDATISGRKIHLTNGHYKLTNGTAGRVVYNQTIRLSSLVSFTTGIQFVMKYYNLSIDDYGGNGIAFFMTSKQVATQRTWSSSGLPGNGSELSADTVAVIFDSPISSIFSYLGKFRPIEYYYLNESFDDGRLWNVRIDYNFIKKNLQVFLSNASNSSMSQTVPVLERSLDLSKYLPEYLVLGISASVYYSIATHTILSWSFSTKTKTTKSSTKIIILVTVVGVLFCLGGTVVIWNLFVIAKKKRRLRRQTCEDNEIEIDMIVASPCRYKLDDLKAGTNNFSEALKLGQGGFGRVYRGVIGEANQVVAVKRLSQGARHGIKQFLSEVTIISRVRHRNLVQLLGWCHEKGELLLVYEYMSNGSLDKHLFSSKADSPPLQWSRRYRIALEIACGLMYLHEEWDQCIVHRDVKSSNVMLDSNFSAKLGDFGLARMLEHNRPSQTTIVAGTLGYLAPECVITGRTSPQSDVYSFGAVALEIATGRRVIDASLLEHNWRLVEWVWHLYGEGKVLEAADRRLNGEFEKAKMEQLTGIGLWCSHPDPAERPKMTQVVKLLKLEAQLPQLPLALPVPTYAAVPGFLV